jgi:hypothetical protein
VVFWVVTRCNVSEDRAASILTLGSWDRIPLEAWMCVRIFLFVCCAVLRR